MAKSHRQLSIIKLSIGSICIISGILLLFYSIRKDFILEPEFLLPLTVSVLLIIGFYFYVQAGVHQVKADIRERGQHRVAEKNKALD